MNLYRVTRKYNMVHIVDLVFANDEREVHLAMDWEYDENPKLEIEEIKTRPGCVMSLSVPAPGSYVFPGGTLIKWGTQL